MSDTRGPGPLLARVRRHERRLALAWLIAVGVIGLSVVVGPVRTRVLDGAEAAARWWDGRWSDRLAEGERLVVDGRFAEAVEFLERLDRIHPARNVRHARDKERERVLTLLGQSYEALDRRSRALETYQRLVEFDPRHYRNHFELAQASDRLLSRAVMAPEALAAYVAALDIFPAHLPSVRGAIGYHVDRGEFQPVVDGYERYLDAYLVQHVQVRLGNAVVEFPVIVDGRLRDYEVSMATGAVVGEGLTVATGGFAMRVERAALGPAMRVGVAVQRDEAAADLTAPDLVEFEPIGGGSFRALGPDSAVRLRVPDAPEAISTVRLRLALFKPVDRALWAVVSKSYLNLLNEAGRAAAAARTVAFDSESDADAVMERLIWAQEGVLQRSGEDDD